MKNDQVLDRRGEPLEFICNACGKPLVINDYDDEGTIVRLSCPFCDADYESLEDRLNNAEDKIESLTNQLETLECRGGEE